MPIGSIDIFIDKSIIQFLFISRDVFAPILLLRVCLNHHFLKGSCFIIYAHKVKDSNLDKNYYPVVVLIIHHWLVVAYPGGISGTLAGPDSRVRTFHWETVPKMPPGYGKYNSIILYKAIFLHP